MSAGFITIDENGDIYLDSDSPAVTDPNFIEEIHRNLKLTDKFGLLTEFHDEEYIVESFDHPLHIIAVEFKEKKIYSFKPSKIRFSRLTTQNGPLTNGTDSTA